MSDSTPKAPPYRFLISRPYIKDTIMQLIEELQAEVLVDCGAFTYARSGESPELANYVDWLRALPFDPVGYFQLDVIGDAEATLRNYREMLDMGLRPIPVWTRGAPIEHFREMADAADYVAIGGVALHHLIGGVSEYLRWVHEEVVRPGDKVHWLGIFKPQLVNYYHPLQVDASSWVNGRKYGTWKSYTGNGYWGKRYDVRVQAWRESWQLGDYQAVRAVGCDPNVVVDGQDNFELMVASAGQMLRYAADLEALAGTRIFFVCNSRNDIGTICEARRRGIERGLYVGN